MKQSNDLVLPFSESLPAGDVLYISGQVGINPATNALVTANFRGEVKQVMENIGKVLQQYDLTYSALVNVTIYLTDMTHYDETNDIYRQYFSTTYPARVCIAVNQLPLKANIEISAIARLSPGKGQ
jgi:reactive intermediate/imine deaminase